MTRKIIHIDMDCFYAAVEVRDRPELRGEPVAVGGRADARGVIATANYEARAFGVRSAMPTSRALRLCKRLVVLPPDFARYKAESRKVRAILERFSERIEPLSLDEAYIDVSGASACEGSATRIAREIRRLIKTEIGLTASAGVAPNKFLAKIASEWNKPDGMRVIRPDEVEALMPALKIESIFGVGRVTAAKMHALGIRTCGDLQQLTLGELTSKFGRWGASLFNYARGIDERPVESMWERRSLTVETTFRKDLEGLDECLEQVPRLFEMWTERINKSGLNDKIRGLVVKLKFHDFKSTTHETRIDRPPMVSDFSRLLEEAWRRRAAPVRLIGLGARLATASDEAPQFDPRQLRFALD